MDISEGSCTTNNVFHSRFDIDLNSTVGTHVPFFVIDNNSSTFT